MLKAGKILAVLVLGGLALFAFGRFFLSELGNGRGAANGPAGVIESPPEGYELVERGSLTPAAAAADLMVLLSTRPGPRKVGIHFENAGSSYYWLADTAADRLEERAAGASGTRLQTVWQGRLADRLRWASAHGDPAAPGLAPGEKHNLYH